MKKVWIFTISIILLLAILLSVFLIIRKDNAPLSDFTPCYTPSDSGVKRIIDGDTFELCSGEIVRLLCVNTPEEGEEGYEEASNFLLNTILFREVTLAPSNYQGNDTDKYARLLRWIYITNETTGEKILVNKLILEEGYGDIMIIPPETCDEVSD